MLTALFLLFFFTQNYCSYSKQCIRSHLLTQKCYHSLPSSVNGTDCQEFKITIVITFFKFGPVLRTWPFFLLTEGVADAQQYSKPKQFIHGNRSDFRGHSNFRDYNYIFTFSALTLLTCSLLFHCLTPGLALEQSCSSSSLLLSLFYLA